MATSYLTKAETAALIADGKRNAHFSHCYAFYNHNDKTGSWFGRPDAWRDNFEKGADCYQFSADNRCFPTSYPDPSGH